MELLDRDKIVTKALGFGAEPDGRSAIEMADELTIKLWEVEQRQKAAKYRAQVSGVDR